MKYTPLDPSVRKELLKNTPESLFKVDGYLADLRVNREHPQDYEKKERTLNKIIAIFFLPSI